MIMILRKPEKSTHDVLLIKQKLSYQLIVVNLEFKGGDKLKSTREIFEKNSAILLIKI